MALLIVALEAEENERYLYGVITSIAFNDPKKLKKLKPKHRKVGRQAEPARAVTAFAMALTKGNLQTTGSPEELAAWTGRTVVWLGDDGILRDKSGQQIARDHSRQVVVRGYPH